MVDFDEVHSIKLGSRRRFVFFGNFIHYMIFESIEANNVRVYFSSREEMIKYLKYIVNEMKYPIEIIELENKENEMEQ